MLSALSTIPTSIPSSVMRRRVDTQPRRGCPSCLKALDAPSCLGSKPFGDCENWAAIPELITMSQAIAYVHMELGMLISRPTLITWGKQFKFIRQINERGKIWVLRSKMKKALQEE